MFSRLLEAAAVAAALVAFARAENIPTPTASVTTNKMTYQGCFSSSDPLTDYGPFTFQSRGNCQAICVLLDQPVMALMDGTKCFCGSLLPAADTQVDKEECNAPCGGYEAETCGGKKAWEVFLDGLSENSIANYDPSSTSSASAQPTEPSTSVFTEGDITTIVLTVSTSTGSSSKSGPSTAGIVAGVVVGVFGLASIIGGVFLFLRQRKRKQAQEEERQRTAVAAKSEFVE